jgi:hypothetical protein
VVPRIRIWYAAVWQEQLEVELGAGQLEGLIPCNMEREKYMYLSLIFLYHPSYRYSFLTFLVLLCNLSVFQSRSLKRINFVEPEQEPYRDAAPVPATVFPFKMY